MPSIDLPASSPGESPRQTKRSISLVLPAWNEVEALPRAVREADAALRAAANDYEILIVDDGSTDHTAVVAAKLALEFPAVRLVRHPENRGYGAALRSGFAEARCDLVAFTDADNQFDLTEIDRFVLLAERYDVVCGYRIDRKDSALRCFYSRGYNLMIRLLLGISVRDIDCAMKMFRRDVARKLEISTNGFLVNSELLTQVKQQCFSLVEVGVTHRPRTEGTSTVSIAHIPRVLTDLARWWWNRVQFPGESKPRSLSPKDLKQVNWVTCALIAAAAVLLISNLGYPLIDRDETRYAEIPREMYTSGNWALPQLNFRPYYDKPPLMYWLGSISYMTFGVSEWSARLPHVLCMLGTLVATIGFARRWFGPEIGLLSGLVHLLSVGFMCLSRILLIDGLLTLTSVFSLGCAYEAMRSGRFRWGWWLAASVACGLGFLAKGPVALVLMAPPLMAFAFLTNGLARLRLRHWVALVGVVTAMFVPWLLAVSAQQPNFAYEFFYLHNVARFGGAFHAQPFWYFLPILLIAGHPWSFLTFSVARFLGAHDVNDQRMRPPILGFLLLWSGWCVLFFSISSCKLPTYILPALPALAIVVAHYFQLKVLDVDPSRLRFFERVAPWNAALITGVAGVGFAIFCGSTGVETVAVAVSLGVAWMAVTVFSQVLRFRRQSGAVAWGFSLGMMALLSIVVTHREMPLYAAQRTLFGPGSPLAKQAASFNSLPIATLSHEWAEVPFYLGRNNVQNLTKFDPVQFASIVSSEKRLLVVIRKKDDPRAFASLLPAGAEMRPLITRGPGTLFEVIAGPDAVAQSPDSTTARR